jgi:hypothetical protein
VLQRLDVIDDPAGTRTVRLAGRRTAMRAAKRFRGMWIASDVTGTVALDACVSTARARGRRPVPRPPVTAVRRVRPVAARMSEGTATWTRMAAAVTAAPCECARRERQRHDKSASRQRSADECMVHHDDCRDACGARAATTGGGNGRSPARSSSYMAAIALVVATNHCRIVAGASTSTASPNASNHQRSCGVSAIVARRRTCPSASVPSF